MSEIASLILLDYDEIIFSIVLWNYDLFQRVLHELLSHGLLEHMVMAMSITPSMLNQSIFLPMKASAMIGRHTRHQSSSLFTAHLRGMPPSWSEAVFAYGHTALTTSNF